MTPKQIQKSIAAAEKALAKATKNVAMYRNPRKQRPRHVRAEKSGVNVSTEMFKTEWSCANHCSVRYIANNVDVWSIVYPITNAWESMLENEYWMEKHARRIQSFTDWAWRLSAKMRTDCERKGIDPENCPILGDFTAVLGALEYFIQEHHKNGLQ